MLYSLAVMTDAALMCFSWACIMGTHHPLKTILPLFAVLVSFSWYDLQRTIYSTINRLNNLYRIYRTSTSQELCKDKYSLLPERKYIIIVESVIAAAVTAVFCNIFQKSNVTALLALSTAIFGASQKTLPKGLRYFINMAAWTVAFFNAVSMFGKYIRLIEMQVGLTPAEHSHLDLKCIMRQREAIFKVLLSTLLTILVSRGPLKSISKTIQIMMSGKKTVGKGAWFFIFTKRCIHVPLFLLTYSQSWDAVTRMMAQLKSKLSFQMINNTLRKGFRSNDDGAGQEKYIYSVLILRAACASVKSIKKKPSMIEGAIYGAYHFFDKEKTHPKEVEEDKMSAKKALNNVLQQLHQTASRR